MGALIRVPATSSAYEKREEVVSTGEVAGTNKIYFACTAGSMVGGGIKKGLSLLGSHRVRSNFSEAPAAVSEKLLEARDDGYGAKGSF